MFDIHFMSATLMIPSNVIIISISMAIKMNEIPNTNILLSYIDYIICTIFVMVDYLSIVFICLSKLIAKL